MKNGQVYTLDQVVSVALDYHQMQEALKKYGMSAREHFCGTCIATERERERTKRMLQEYKQRIPATVQKRLKLDLTALEARVR